MHKVINELKVSDKIKYFLVGILAIPCLIGIFVTLAWIRKHTSEFWANVFGI